MRVKICGMMRQEDIEAASDHGADAVGFVVGTPNSRRNLTLAVARELVENVPIFTSTVAVTSTCNRKVLQNIITKLNPDVLQLHSPDLKTVNDISKRNPGVRLILGTPIHNAESIVKAEVIAKYSDALIADSPSELGIGGTGRVHDWRLTARLRNRIYPKPLILAGGLTVSNVRDAIKKVKPFGVDVSSGVERAIGVKDDYKMKEFIKQSKGTGV
jgi:phosphoribosylanthranilate isomerase